VAGLVAADAQFLPRILEQVGPVAAVGIVAGLAAGEGVHHVAMDDRQIVFRMARMAG
jgi:hypothetical protein